MFNEYNFTVTDRFLEYVKIDTQADENSETCPSSEKQKDLSRKLVDELKAIGLDDAHMDENGYVMATLKSNSDKNVEVIGFIAHVDTSPAVSGTNVNPQILKNYSGGDIVLPNGIKIEADKNPELEDMIGQDIVHTDGTTLLGADDKAGIAAIMDAMAFFHKNPEIKHGTIKVGFTPDEEIGRGANKFDVEKFGAKYAYTIDGSTRGEVETETFSADGVDITITGINVHPGYAKGKMVNSLKVASHFIDLLPKERMSPETTEGREGYVHCVNMSGNEEKTNLKFIIRDFLTPKLKDLETELENILKKAVADYPGAEYEFKVIEQYRNMKDILDQHPQVEEFAVESLKRLGIKPIQSAIRGGTDGSRLSYMGLPTPNLFAGGHNFHANTEYVSIQDMEASVKNIVTLSTIWEEKA